MSASLHLIETRLKTLIEEWIIPFKTEGFQNILAHQLVQSMHSNLQSDHHGKFIAPYQYTIRLNASLVDELRGSDIIQRLPEALEEAARLGGITFMRRPNIRLQPEPGFTNGEIEVLSQSEHISPGHTAALSLKKANQRGDDPTGLNISAYLILNGETIYNLNRPATNIGRRSDNHLVIEDSRVSRVHAQIRLSRGKFVLFDLNSSGGTCINGQRIHQHALTPGDVISLAGVALIYGEEPKPGEGVSDTIRITPPPAPPGHDEG